MKLVVALALLNVGLADDSLDKRVAKLELQVEQMKSPVESCCGATAQNGCGELCADIITISSTSFPTIESSTLLLESDNCYVVDGTFPTGIIEVPDIQGGPIDEHTHSLG